MYEIIKTNKGLSVERLLLLCEVDKAGGIKAAVGDDTTRQSLASRQLKELGAYAGADLCRKVGRTIEMTNQGKQLSEIGNSFFHALARLFTFDAALTFFTAIISHRRKKLRESTT